MNIHITSRGWIESWKSSASVHVRGLENPVLCYEMWWVVSDIFSMVRYINMCIEKCSDM